jgi:hypothetical protein
MNGPKRLIRRRGLLKVVLGVSTVTFTVTAGCVGNLMAPPCSPNCDVVDFDAGAPSADGGDAGPADASVPDAGETDAGSDGGS